MAFQEGREADLEGKIQRLKGELAEVRSQLSAQPLEEVVEKWNRQSDQCRAANWHLNLAEVRSPQPPEILELPEAADLLNQLKSKRKKSAATLADVEAILDMI